jgi:hypothetical protein
MLGFTLSVDYSMYDRKNKTHNFLKTSLGLNILESFAETEKLKQVFQNRSPFEVVAIVPSVNFFGIYNLSSEADEMPAGKSIEIKSVESDNPILTMQYYIQNDILTAQLIGLKLDEDHIRNVMNNI